MKGLFPKDPFVCPKEGITHSNSGDGIGTQIIKSYSNGIGIGFLGINNQCPEI